MKWSSAGAAVLAIAALRTVSAQGPDPGEHHRVIQQYCAGCHSDRTRTGGLSLESLDPAAIPANADTWEKVVRKLRAGAMPPAGIRRPDEATSRKLIEWLEDRLDRAAAAHPAAGLPAAHRLNRAEYANAVRDLLGLEVPRELLPPADDSSFGFDNIADQLRPSPALLERYVSASEKISALAIGNRAPEPVDVTYRAPSDLTQTTHLDGLPLGTRGGMVARHLFPADGEYVIKPKLWRSNSGFLRGMNRQHEMEISVDGARVHLAAIGGPDDFIPLITLPLAAEAGIDARTQVRLPVKAGPRAVAVTFVEKSDGVALEILQPFQAALDPFDANGLPQIDTVTITGPYHPAGPGDTPSRRRIFVCYPKTANEEAPCASEILRTLARRAYRRPVNEADVKVLRAFYETGRKKGGFEEGIRMALRRLLAESEFIFRFERTGPRTLPGRIQPISDLELASSLSFFLWSSIPDEELLREATRGRLHRTEVLDQQVRRMIADPKSRALVDNFAGQWLYLRNLQSVAPDRILFPDFDDNLRQALARELELFFESIVREDRSVLEFLTGDYTFLNERLARHYGLPDVHGTRFRRVRLTSAERYGLLGKGAILTVTSHADRTSPVQRGKWILDNLLGAPPSAPPAGVPELKQNSERPAPLSMRAQMEEHRSNATCATCHQVMDPLGFALENFDAVGAWRTSDAGVPIDASDRLTDGTDVNGPASLQRVVKPELFVRTLTEKLLTYGLGRGLTHEDAPTVRAIVKQAARDGYRFSSLLSGVVHSVPFRMRTAPPPGNAASAAFQ